MEKEALFGNLLRVYTGEYTRAEHIPEDGMIVTIEDVQPVVSNDKGTLLITSPELPRPWFLNRTGARVIAALLESKRREDWLGKRIEIALDPTVEYLGNRGSIIIRQRLPREDTPGRDA